CRGGAVLRAADLLSVDRADHRHRLLSRKPAVRRAVLSPLPAQGLGRRQRDRARPGYRRARAHTRRGTAALARSLRTVSGPTRQAQLRGAPPRSSRSLDSDELPWRSRADKLTEPCRTLLFCLLFFLSPTCDLVHIELP